MAAEAATAVLVLDLNLLCDALLLLVVGHVGHNCHGGEHQEHPQHGSSLVAGLGDVGMAVGHHEAGGHVAADHGVVAFHSHLTDGVDDLHTVGILGQANEGAGPVLLGGQDQSLVGQLTVGIQGNGDRIGTEAVLIVAVGPGLGDGV